MKHNKHIALLKIASMNKNSQSIAFGERPVPMPYYGGRPVPMPDYGGRPVPMPDYGEDVKGLDLNGLLNKYLSKLPYTDAPHTDDQFWTAVNPYKSKIPEKYNRTQDLLGGFLRLGFQGVPFTDEASFGLADGWWDYAANAPTPAGTNAIDNVVNQIVYNHLDGNYERGKHARRVIMGSVPDQLM